MDHPASDTSTTAIADEAGQTGLAHAVHWVLTGGLLVSTVLIVSGLAVVFVAHQPRPVGSPPAVRQVLAGAMRGDGLCLLELGLVTLMLTPVARVVTLGAGWGWNRDWRSMLIAWTVLGLLGASIVLGTG